MSRPSDSVPFTDPITLLKKFGLTAKKRLSQNFLRSEGAVRAIVGELSSMDAEQVVELGPGLGTLTEALLSLGLPITAVEMDPDMVRIVREQWADAGVNVVLGDAAAVDLTSLDAGNGIAVAGNLPYAVTGAIFRNLIRHREAVLGACLMVQREVQQRLVAKPGTKAYGALTVFTQCGFDVRSVMTVKPTAFVPPPKVHSAIVVMHQLQTPRAVMDDAFTAIVRAAFQQRRKTLRNALRVLADSSQIDRALDGCGIDGRRRGETLHVEEFGALAAAWNAQ